MERPRKKTGKREKNRANKLIQICKTYVSKKQYIQDMVKKQGISEEKYNFKRRIFLFDALVESVQF